MDIHTLFSVPKARWFEDVLSVIFIIVGVFCGPPIALAVLTNLDWINSGPALVQKVFNISGLCGLVVTPLFVHQTYVYGERIDTLLKERLAPLDKAQLIRMSSSPELPEGCRTVVVQILNSKHPGWSFDLPTVNVTT